MKYIYKGITIVDYDEETKQCTFPDDKVGVTDKFKEAHITHVHLLPEDHMLLAEFHLKVYQHMVGHADVDLSDIIVNI